MKENRPYSGKKFNQIGHATNILFNIILLTFALLCALPVVYIFIISISSESSLRQYGYRIIPESLSMDAYRFLWNERSQIFRSLFNSVTVTVSGTLLGLSLTTLMGYVLSRHEYRLNGFLTWLVFIPMMFSGGMVASYVINRNLYHLSNTLWVIILTMACSPFNITICTTFFKTTIPEGIVESAKIEGAGHFYIFVKVVLPIAKPLLATIGLFLCFEYWNEWSTSMLYINKKELYTLQAMLNGILANIEFIASNPQMLVSNAQYVKSMPSESMRMAIVMVIVIPICCVYPFFQKYFVGGMTIGAVKG